MDKDIDPSDIGKHPAIIKVAQAEMAQTDVLVCGNCHNVFHFIELFKEHKDNGCNKESSLRDCRETKPKVWAFLLWKASQLNSEETANINSWKLYQTWVKMDETIRETWVVAGRTIQSFGRMGQGNLQEMPVKITKTVVDTATKDEKKEPIKKPSILNRTPITTINKTSPPIRAPIKPVSRIAKRTSADNTLDEETVEKILAKRFNPRKKQYEYLVKWENYTHDQNTWEQLPHFDQCKHLLEHFEEQLARQKEQRAKFQQVNQNNAKTPTPVKSIANTTISPSRPTRNSKSKAIDQVKQWCAADEESGGITITSMKRKMQSSADEEDDMTDDPDDDFGNNLAKKIKTDNPAVAQALRKAEQSGNVRIVQVNKNLNSNVSTPVKNNGITKKIINGSSTTVNNKNSAEVVVAKDGKTTTGVIKKPGVVINSNKTSSTEAKVRVLSKGDSTQSGVIRISEPNKGIESNSNSPKLMTSPIKTASPQQTIQRGTAKPPPPLKQTPVQKVGQPKRFSLSPEGSTVHNKTTITRIVKSVPNSTKSTPETHKTITYRTSDGKLIRRPAPSSHQQNNKDQATAEPFPDEMKDEDEEDDELPDPFPTELPPPEPDSPPLPMTLCPITGKVLLRAEGEKTPPPSPEPAPEQEPESPVKVESKIEESQAAQEMKVDEQNTIQELQPMTNEDGSPLLVTGEDGTIYQIAGKNEEGQTILIAQGSDGEQQCVYIAAQEDDDGVLGLDPNGENVWKCSGC